MKQERLDKLSQAAAERDVDQVLIGSCLYDTGVYKETVERLRVLQ